MWYCILYSTEGIMSYHPFDVPYKIFHEKGFTNFTQSEAFSLCFALIMG